MHAVYLCGCTDCFLHALFVEESKAIEWAEANSVNPEGYKIVVWDTPSEIDTSDTGWYRQDDECLETSGTY